MFQKTIKEPIEFTGVGLHNGVNVNLCLKPAEVDSGIKFKRTDVEEDQSIIEASFENVSSPILCTKIKNSYGVSVSTIEHLMAVFYGEGIDNVLIEIDKSDSLTKLYESIKEKGNSKIQICIAEEDKNYLFELKDKRKFDVETLKYLNREPYIKKINV